MAPPLEVEESLLRLQRDPPASSSIRSVSDSSPEDSLLESRAVSRQGGELLVGLEKREKELADSIL